ncbi:G-type lectin S-receptor-like serine/threonine-protein kinase At2g19130 isoform X2 [Prunus persica]|uniref:G-type lectin S-receptor-like serine/threonine-protein kinase At2g19130 isoform X2 n=1 Tax=Prunus persica TaxID=3760 RepID=UPI0009AB6A93|nr:G-type lectin S-receptor-like serine/threonine-protein kinase At2g19130 isoform X2 [Prunus persica]
MDAKTKQSLVLLLCLCLHLKTHVCLAVDTITANQSLSGDQTILSAEKVFELGFFKPGNSSNYYIGMWYSKRLVSLETIVWVANRETPVSDRFSSVLRITDGNLVLFNESNTPIWSTYLASTANSGSAEAVLLDSGNLVLRNAGSNANTSEPLWQSFDHPTHTWLPGARIGFNSVTTSWKSSEDPAPGLFTLELDPNGSNAYRLLWNRSRQYWSSGAWDEKSRIFSGVPEMNRQIQQHTWLENPGKWNFFWSKPGKRCDVYDLCGAFGSCNEVNPVSCNCLTGFEPKLQRDWNLQAYSGGCKRKTPLHCENATSADGKQDQFLKKPGMSLPENEQSVKVETIAGCESICLNNCSCTAYAYNSSGCSIWIGDLFNLQEITSSDSQGITLYLRLAASEFKSPKSNKGLIIGVVAGSAAGIAILLGLIVVVILRQRKRVTGTGKAVEGSLVAFGYRDLQDATKNFSEKLGGGGFGSVFKGTLPDSSVIAVKKLESVNQGEKQFRTEVSTIGTIQHVNLVRLRGFCSEGTKRMLVYDYMPNGSLDSHLFHDTRPNVLDWKTRYQIALGTARGLAYLHLKCRDCIIHCDIKPENILVDNELGPKVADFGLAKLVGREFSRVLTTIRGTRGYLAPEWISGVAITMKADVYSYGMMLFEFVSGRRNSEQSEDGKVRFFPSWAASQISTAETDVLSLLDPRLDGNADVQELTRICRVACWCVQDDEAHRPSMGQVVQILEGVSDVNLPPIPRSLQFLGDDQEHIIFFTESSSSQSSHQRSNNTSTASSQTKSTTSSTISKRSEEERQINT